jgi:hypothetical protein
MSNRLDSALKTDSLTFQGEVKPRANSKMSVSFIVKTRVPVGSSVGNHYPLKIARSPKKEARRDGVPPIELVDGEKLVDMFEYLELGVKPVTTYEVDIKFFNEFMS